MRLIALAVLAAILIPVSVVEAAKKPKGEVTLVAFGAKYCGACHKLKPTLDKIEAKGYKVIHVDVGTAKGKAIAKRLGVTDLPTCIVFDGNGKEQGRTEGVVSEGVLLGLLKVARAVLMFAIKAILF
jgi:thiol-disulfide isomerase/thioredoxin